MVMVKPPNVVTKILPRDKNQDIEAKNYSPYQQVLRYFLPVVSRHGFSDRPQEDNNENSE